MSRELPFDPSPKRIWFGGSIPGKKMAALLVDAGILDSTRELVGLYEQDPPGQVLHAVAIALRQLPISAPAGPSARNVFRGILPRDLHGASITDVRDFLKLRFRASGLQTPKEETEQQLAQRKAVDSAAGPNYVVNFVISALDALAQDRADRLDLSESVCFLADALVGATAILSVEAAGHD